MDSRSDSQRAAFPRPEGASLPPSSPRTSGLATQWAVQNTGKDPFDSRSRRSSRAQEAEAAKSQVQGSSKGAGAKGVRSRAPRREPSSERSQTTMAGKGAGVGAAAGVVAGRRKGKKAEAEATKQIDQQAQAQQAATSQDVTKLQEGVHRLPRGKRIHCQVLRLGRDPGMIARGRRSSGRSSCSEHGPQAGIKTRIRAARPDPLRDRHHRRSGDETSMKGETQSWLTNKKSGDPTACSPGISQRRKSERRRSKTRN